MNILIYRLLSTCKTNTMFTGKFCYKSASENAAKSNTMHMAIIILNKLSKLYQNYINLYFLLHTFLTKIKNIQFFCWLYNVDFLHFRHFFPVHVSRKGGHIFSLPFSKCVPYVASQFNPLKFLSTKLSCFSN